MNRHEGNSSTALPSSIFSVLVTQILVYPRIKQHSAVTTVQNVVTNQARPFRLGGLLKSGVIPLGGSKAGCASSEASCCDDVDIAIRGGRNCVEPTSPTQFDDARDASWKMVYDENGLRGMPWSEHFGKTNLISKGWINTLYQHLLHRTLLVRGSTRPLPEWRELG